MAVKKVFCLAHSARRFVKRDYAFNVIPVGISTEYHRPLSWMMILSIVHQRPFFHTFIDRPARKLVVILISQPKWRYPMGYLYHPFLVTEYWLSITEACRRRPAWLPPAFPCSPRPTCQRWSLNGRFSAWVSGHGAVPSGGEWTWRRCPGCPGNRSLQSLAGWSDRRGECCEVTAGRWFEEHFTVMGVDSMASFWDERNTLGAGSKASLWQERNILKS